MTPNELHALPSIAVVPWHEASLEDLSSIFGAHIYNIDYDAAMIAAPRIKFHDKFVLHHGYDDFTRIRTVTFDDFLVAIIRSYPGDGRESYFIDPVRIGQAQLWMLSFIDTRYVTTQATGADDDIEHLEGSACFVKVGDETRLVLGDRVEDDGTLLFDDVRFSSAFDNIVRPLYRGDHSDSARDGFQNTILRKHVMDCVLTSIPVGPKVYRIEKFGSRKDFIAFEIVGNLGVYEVYWPSYRQGGWFSWVKPSIRKKQLTPA